MFKRNKTWEALAIGVLGLGAVVATRALVGSTQRRISRLNEASDPHEYAVMYSAHGGQFLKPAPDKGSKWQYKTRSQAVREADHFVSMALAIEGKAKVVNVRTGEEVPF